MQNELKEKALDLLGQFSEELASKGLACEISQKYSQHRISPSSFNPHHRGFLFVLFETFLRRIKQSREKEIFKNQPDRYYTLVLKFIPCDKALVKKVDCKEYSFLCKKITRYEAGYTPKKKEYQENKILNKIEKRIRKTLNNANKMSVEKICKNDFWSNLRYLNSEKYHYKKTVFGKDKNFVELVIGLTAFAIIIIGTIILWIIF